MKKVLISCFLTFLVSSSIYGQSQSLVFESKDHDFGLIKEEDGPVDFTFNFTNASENPIKIEQVRASCGCTTPDWSKTEISPGETGMVQARYNPLNRPGSFKKSLTVTTSNQERYVLYINGKVQPKPRTPEDDFPTKMGNLWVKYRGFNMGKVLNNGVTEKKFNVYNGGDSILSFSQNYEAPDHIKLKFIPYQVLPGTQGEITVSYDAKLRDDLGFITDNVRIYTSETDSLKNFTVFANIEEYFPPMTAEELKNAPKLQIESPVHDFGKLKSGDIVKNTFYLTNQGQTELLIRKTATSCGCTISELEKDSLKPGEKIGLTVTFNSSGRRGNQQKTVTVFSNDPQNPSQRITIKASVSE